MFELIFVGLALWMGWKLTKASFAILLIAGLFAYVSILLAG